MYKCQVAAHYHKADRSKTACESKRDCSVSDSGVVKGSALTKQREQKSSSESTVQEASLVFCSLRPGVPVPGLTSLEEKKCRGQMADWCSVCLKVGSDTLGSSCVQVYIQSHVRNDQKGFVSKWVSKLTRGEPFGTGTWQKGKWKQKS